MTHVAPDKITVAAICDAVGRRRIADRLGRKLTAVSNAVSEGVFPSSWYLAVRDLCDEAGIGCPVGLFGFVSAAPAASAPVSPSEKDLA